MTVLPDLPQINAPRVMDLLREAVAAKSPGYVYTNPEGRKAGTPDPDQFSDNPSATECLYVHPTPDGPTPGCIVAHVFHAHGVPLTTLAGHEDEAADAVGFRLRVPPAEPDADDLPLLTASAAHILSVAQSMQDYGASWGTVLRVTAETFDLRESD